MSSKHKGLCPFCKEIVRPIVIEENVFRRDKCLCPECAEHIYVCRMPGCENYAKGGVYYDDELCPSCTLGARGSVPAIITAVPAVLSVIASIVAKKDVAKKD